MPKIFCQIFFLKSLGALVRGLGPQNGGHFCNQHKKMRLYTIFFTFLCSLKSFWDPLVVIIATSVRERYQRNIITEVLNGRNSSDSEGAV